MTKLSKIVATASFMVILAGINLTQPIWERDFALATSSRPMRFSELYFNDLRTLPTTVTAAQPAKLRFTIVNHEGARRNYTYRISVTEDGRTRTSTANVLLQPEQSVTLPVSFVASKANKNITVVIDLPEKNQSINFRSKS